jgi:hypothetical protein
MASANSLAALKDVGHRISTADGGGALYGLSGRGDDAASSGCDSEHPSKWRGTPLWPPCLATGVGPEQGNATR